MSTKHQPLRYFRVVAILAALAMCLTPIASYATIAAQSAAPAVAGGDNTTNLPPLITHNPNKGPTGYTVTFRYRDPSATRVQIKGEWYFESPWDLPQPASTPGNPGGISEGIIGRWIKAAGIPRQRLVLATKVRGRLNTATGPNEEGLSRLMETESRTLVTRALKELGYIYVVVDVEADIAFVRVVDVTHDVLWLRVGIGH